MSEKYPACSWKPKDLLQLGFLIFLEVGTELGIIEHPLLLGWITLDNSANY